MLTDTEIKKVKADGKPRKLFDAHGLFLFVTQGTDWGATHKRWRFKFTFHKKEKLFALGVYPAVTLAEARKRRDKAQALLEQGVDPTAERKTEKRETSLRLGNTFRALANDWFDTKREGWSPRYAADTRKFLDRELITEFGNQPIAEITPRDLLAVIRKIERRDAPAIAEKVLNIGGQILRHGVLTGLLSWGASIRMAPTLRSSPRYRPTRGSP